MPATLNIDGVLIQWGDRLFYPGNRMVRGQSQPRLKRAAGEVRITRLGWGLLALVGVQFMLGVMVIWKGRHPHITNTHVMVGAFICACTALLAARSWRVRA